jgi:hypothetical protein
MRKVIIIIYLVGFTIYAQGEFKLLTSISGEKAGDHFSKVCPLGDVNGDGYDDFLVGSLEGKYVKLYFGGSPFDTLNYLRFYSNEPYTAFGNYFVGQGDLNGDGYKDFVLGANYGFGYSGKIFIYFGKPNITTKEDLTITSDYPYDFFSPRSISGDLNGDGYDDLVTFSLHGTFDARGKVSVFFGGTEMDTIPDVILWGEKYSDHFGYSSAIVGDANGDGFDDLLVGVPQLFSEKKIGKAYLFFGGIEIGWNNAIEIKPDSNAYEYGITVEGLGDVDGDGFNDFGIMSQGGLRNIVLGGEKIYRDNGLSFWGSSLWSMGKLHDINNDGYDDYSLTKEKVEIYFGNRQLDTSQRLQLNFWASVVVNLGDINGDDKDEIAFGIGGGWNPRGIVEIYNYDFETSVNTQEPIIANDFIIHQNYPNPFNPTTKIKYSIPETGLVVIKVYDMLGKEMAMLVNDKKPAGQHEVTFDGSSLPSGIYFYSINYNKQRLSGKMILLK